MTFLLGAALVGGVIGATADRLLLAKDPGERSWGVRRWMYEDLRLNERQRQAIDSVLDEANRSWNLVLASRKRELDSLAASTDGSIRKLLTAEQRAQLDSTVNSWRERMKRREAEREAQRKKAAAQQPQQQPGNRDRRDSSGDAPRGDSASSPVDSVRKRPSP